MPDLVVASLGTVLDATANAIDILSLAEAKLALNIPTATSTYDGELAQVNTQASQFVDGIDGAVVQRTVTETVRNPRGSEIVLDTYPIASVTSVTEYSGGVASALTAESVTVAGGYTFESSTGVLSRRSSWYQTSFDGETLVIVYVAGRYVNTVGVAPLYKGAAAAALSHFWQQRGANSGAATFGGDGVPFAGVPYSTMQLRKQLQATLCGLTPGLA